MPTGPSIKERPDDFYLLERCRHPSLVASPRAATSPSRRSRTILTNGCAECKCLDFPMDQVTCLRTCPRCLPGMAPTSRSIGDRAAVGLPVGSSTTTLAVDLVYIVLEDQVALFWDRDRQPVVNEAKSRDSPVTDGAA